MTSKEPFSSKSADFEAVEDRASTSEKASAKTAIYSYNSDGSQSIDLNRMGISDWVAVIKTAVENIEQLQSDEYD